MAEFQTLIVDKLDQAKKDYELLKNTLCHTDDHGTDDTSPTFKALEDGSDVLTEKKQPNLPYARKNSFKTFKTHWFVSKIKPMEFAG